MSAATPLFDKYAPPADPCASRHGGAQTSEAAFNQARASHAAMRQKILDYLREVGPSTWEEISDALSISYQNSGRVTQLLADELIADSGCRRETRSGCSARVLFAKERG